MISSRWLAQRFYPLDIETSQLRCMSIMVCWILTFGGKSWVAHLADSVSHQASRPSKASQAHRQCIANENLRYEQACLPILVQSYSSAGDTFTKAPTASFDTCGGLAVPPLHVLGQSFLRALFKLRRSGATSRAESVAQWWIASVKDTGYTPLGKGAMKGADGMDEEMQVFWERGY
jgi:hypothetical protein